MTKKELAAEIREYELDEGMLPYTVVAFLTDDELIKIYTHCGCCGTQKFSDTEIKNAISLSESLDSFIGMLDDIKRTRIQAN